MVRAEDPSAVQTAVGDTGVAENPWQMAVAQFDAAAERMGLEAIDVGPVENARWVEGMLMLWINNRYGSDRQNFDFHLRRTD